MTKTKNKTQGYTTCPPQRWVGGTLLNDVVRELSVIGGGTNSFIGGGDQNTIQANFATVGGGQQNTATGNFSAVLGGRNNIVTGADSSIVGGNGNNDGGFPNTHIIGSGIAGAALTSGVGGVFINELVIQNIPVITTPLAWSLLAIGEIYTTVAPNTGLGQSPLFIR